MACDMSNGRKAVRTRHPIDVAPPEAPSFDGVFEEQLAFNEKLKLFRRCNRAFKRDGSFASVESREALAELVSHYPDTPLPAELNKIVQMALRCPRKTKPGPKPKGDPTDLYEQFLFEAYYNRGLEIGQRMLRMVECKNAISPRRAALLDLPVPHEVARIYVRKRLKFLRHLKDGPLDNKLSKLRNSDHQKELPNPFIQISPRSG